MIFMPWDRVRKKEDAMSIEGLEKLAAAEHERWTKWYLWQRDHSTPENIERWNRQAATKYADLSETEKELDRKEARALLAVGTDGPGLREAAAWLLQLAKGNYPKEDEYPDPADEWDAAEQAVDLALANREKEPGLRESGWLIESKGVESGQPLWWKGDSRVCWTTIAAHATRFARKQDADEVIIGRVHDADQWQNRFPFASEHIFIGKALAARPVEEESGPTNLIYNTWKIPCETHGVKWCGEDACKIVAFNAAMPKARPVDKGKNP